MVYTPNLYTENQDSFIWEAMVSGGTVERFRVVIDVNSVKNEPQIGANTHNTKFINTPPEADLSEGQTTSNDLLIYVIDYDSNATLAELVPTIVEDSSNQEMMIGLPLAAWMIRQLEILIASELVVRPF